MNRGLFSDFNLGVMTGLGIGLSFILFLKLKQRGSARNLMNLRQSLLERNNDLPEASEDYKMLMVVNSKLKMEKGKTASQCAHAAVAVFTKTLTKDPAKIELWESEGSKKIVVKALDDEQIANLQKQAKNKGIITYLIQDRGLTQIAPGSRTVLGVGPDRATLIDEVFGGLKLY